MPVYFAELATAITPDNVVSNIAEACGLSLAPDAVGVALLVAALSEKRGLLVVDNAEHVLETVAPIVDTLLEQSRLLRVLVTSHESLRIRLEVVYRVEPLDAPPPKATDADIPGYSAVTLFLLRVNAPQRDADAEGFDVHLVADICRSLDGLPLALELAAARVAALGMAGVHRYLRDRFALPTSGYRTALPRHRTLRAAFNWSFST